MSTTSTIVGAGPAGSLLAILLAQAGHRVELYEQRPDLRAVPVDSGRSINLALATRGIVALEAAGVMDRVNEITIPMVGRMVHEPDGDTGLQRYGNRDDEVIHSVSRNHLNGILLDGAEATGRVTIHFGQRLERVNLDGRILHFVDDDGTPSTAPFDVLYGCDGIGSEVRDSVVEANGGTAAIEPLNHGYKELTLPPAVDGGFRIDPNALHIWARGEFMLIALANPDGDFTVTLFLPNEGTESFASLDDPDRVGAFFGLHFPDVVELIPTLVEQFETNPTGHLGTLRCQGWQVGDHAVLLGDAAHGIVPFHGQGMNAAFESCLVLTSAMARNPDDRAAAFAAFETERRPNTDAIADMALENYVEMRSDVIDERYQLERQLALELERRWPGQFTPRYTMVMFRSLPYAEARRRATQQAEVLTELTEGCRSLDDIDWNRAADLVRGLS
ncbi:MAG: FAD-dependent monooxygenase [Actinomycetia bacterium]|nr:FAD-dependent monooxygenase [Actinomycetes bacterium]